MALSWVLSTASDSYHTLPRLANASWGFFFFYNRDTLCFSAMRKALDKIVELYKTSPVFQDLLETAAGTGIAATGQALLTDMTPEQIALASAAGFGAGMIGRPVAGRAGQALGNVVDKRYPEIGQGLKEGLDQAADMLGPFKPAFEAKLAPYTHLGGASQYFNMIGRGYGDNLAQALVALAAPNLIPDPQGQN